MAADHFREGGPINDQGRTLGPTRNPRSKRRIHAGLSLGPAAELLGLVRERLSALEHGRASVSAEEWQSIFSRFADAGNTGAA